MPRMPRRDGARVAHEKGRPSTQRCSHGYQAVVEVVADQAAADQAVADQPADEAATDQAVVEAVADQPVDEAATDQAVVEAAADQAADEAATAQAAEPDAQPLAADRVDEDEGDTDSNKELGKAKADGDDEEAADGSDVEKDTEDLERDVDPLHMGIAMRKVLTEMAKSKPLPKTPDQEVLNALAEALQRIPGALSPMMDDIEAQFKRAKTEIQTPHLAVPLMYIWRSLTEHGKGCNRSFRAPSGSSATRSRETVCLLVSLRTMRDRCVSDQLRRLLMHQASYRWTTGPWCSCAWTWKCSHQHLTNTAT